MSREQVAAATKVSLRQVEALEAGRFELLPALVFSRGFVRSIGLFLGMDGDALVNEFTRIHRDWSEQEAAAVPPLAHSVSSPRLSRPRRAVSTDTTVRGLAIAAALAVATGGAALLKSRASDKAAAPGAGAVAERAETGPASLGIPPAIAKATVALPPDAPTVQAGSTDAAPAASGAAVVPASGAITLALTFVDDCWTELYADGKKIAAETFPKGVTREFTGGRQYTLTLGNAGGVRITVDGRSVAPLGEPGEVVRNVVIDATRASPPVSG